MRLGLIRHSPSLALECYVQRVCYPHASCFNRSVRSHSFVAAGLRPLSLFSVSTHRQTRETLLRGRKPLPAVSVHVAASSITHVTSNDSAERTSSRLSRDHSNAASLTSASVRARYDALVAAGELRRDAHQEQVVALLDKLLQQLQPGGYKPTAQLLASKRASGQSPGGFIRALAHRLTSSVANNKSEPHISRPRGVYVFGGVGCGKTFLMDLFYDCLPAHLHPHRKRVHFNTFMIDVHRRIHSFRKRHGHGRMDPIPPLSEQLAEEAWVLCFDEFQVTDVADATLLHRLFTRLHECGVVVVATSNRAPADLYKNGLQRELFLPFIDFVNREYDVHHLKSGNDYRLIGHTGKDWKVWFSPTNNTTKQAIDAAFQSMVGDVPVTPMTISVSGHHVHVREQARGVMRASFKELCEMPLGAGDYAAFAHRFHTVVVTDVPYLTLQNRDAARRFILLIDELYQHHTRALISAEDIASKIFDFSTIHKNAEGQEKPLVFMAEDEIFAKDRTVSRLIEMQSEEYLQQAQQLTAERDADRELL